MVRRLAVLVDRYGSAQCTSLGRRTTRGRCWPQQRWMAPAREISSGHSELWPRFAGGCLRLRLLRIERSPILVARMPVPSLVNAGLLPVGVHDATLT